MSCEAWREDLSAYCDGELEPSRLPALEKHLSQCEDCREALSQLRTLRSLGEGLERIEAPSALRQEVLRRIAEREAGASRRRWLLFGVRWVVPAAACCFVFLAARLYFREQPAWPGGQPQTESLAEPMEDAVASQEIPAELRETDEVEVDKEETRARGRDVPAGNYDSDKMFDEEKREQESSAFKAVPVERPHASQEALPVREEVPSQELEMGLREGPHSAPAPDALERSRQTKSRWAVAPKRQLGNEKGVPVDTIRVSSLDEAQKETARLLDEWNGKLVSKVSRGEGKLELVVSLPASRIPQFKDALSAVGGERSATTAEAKETRGDWTLRHAAPPADAAEEEEDMATVTVLLIANVE